MRARAHQDTPVRLEGARGLTSHCQCTARTRWGAGRAVIDSEAGSPMAIGKRAPGEIGGGDVGLVR